VAKKMSVCERYMAQVRRVHGQEVAEASECKEAPSGGFWVCVASEKDADYYTHDELERMITLLSQRKNVSLLPHNERR